MIQLQIHKFYEKIRYVSLGNLGNYLELNDEKKKKVFDKFEMETRNSFGGDQIIALGAKTYTHTHFRSKSDVGSDSHIPSGEYPIANENVGNCNELKIQIFFYKHEGYFDKKITEQQKSFQKMLHQK